MSDFQTIHAEFYDFITEVEIENVRFFLSAVPHVGDEIHYWQDGTEDEVGGEARFRLDATVMRVVHDLRYMPPRMGGSRASFVHSVMLYVKPRAVADTRTQAEKDYDMDRYSHR